MPRIRRRLGLSLKPLPTVAERLWPQRVYVFNRVVNGRNHQWSWLLEEENGLYSLKEISVDQDNKTIMELRFTFPSEGEALEGWRRLGEAYPHCSKVERVGGVVVNVSAPTVSERELPDLSWDDMFGHMSRTADS